MDVDKEDEFESIQTSSFCVDDSMKRVLMCADDNGCFDVQAIYEENSSLNFFKPITFYKSPVLAIWYQSMRILLFSFEIMYCFVTNDDQMNAVCLY